MTSIVFIFQYLQNWKLTKIINNVRKYMNAVNFYLNLEVIPTLKKEKPLHKQE